MKDGVSHDAGFQSTCLVLEDILSIAVHLLVEVKILVKRCSKSSQSPNMDLGIQLQYFDILSLIF